MINEVIVNKEDVYSQIYFIIAVTQKQEHGSMTGALSLKGDLIGGIFDRWINTIPESILFNKIILPSITKYKVEVIPDYYMYNPKDVGIAPDVIGLKYNQKIIPFIHFNEKWVPILDKPQIEVKTFKKKQYLVSLRDQNYAGKYLVMAESNFRIDYLLPFFDNIIFSEDIYNSLQDMNKDFIISNKDKKISKINKIDLSNNAIGTVKLLKITDVEAFEKFSTFCNKNESIQYIKEIQPKKQKPPKAILDEPFSKYCKLNQYGLYEFSLILGICEQVQCKTTSISITGIENIKIVKINKDSIYVEILKDGAIINHEKLHIGFYKINFGYINRSSNSGTEYFMQKSIIDLVPDKSNNLNSILKCIIENELI